jgi:hypothetical protein
MKRAGARRPPSVALKTAPAGAEQYIATCLLRIDHTVQHALEAGWSVLRELLGHTLTAADTYVSGRPQLEELVGQVAPLVYPKIALASPMGSSNSVCIRPRNASAPERPWAIFGICHRL